MITEQKLRQLRLRQIRVQVKLLESQLDAMIDIETHGLWAIGELDYEARRRASECEHILTEFNEFVNMLTAQGQ